jgi:hypothetical protein
MNYKLILIFFYFSHILQVTLTRLGKVYKIQINDRPMTVLPAKLDDEFEREVFFINNERDISGRFEFVYLFKAE